MFIRDKKRAAALVAAALAATPPVAAQDGSSGVTAALHEAGGDRAEIRLTGHVAGRGRCQCERCRERSTLERLGDSIRLKKRDTLREHYRGSIDHYRHLHHPVCPPYHHPSWGFHQTCWRQFPEETLWCPNCPPVVPAYSAPTAAPLLEHDPSDAPPAPMPAPVPDDSVSSLEHPISPPAAAWQANRGGESVEGSDTDSTAMADRSFEPVGDDERALSGLGRANVRATPVTHPPTAPVIEPAEPNHFVATVEGARPRVQLTAAAAPQANLWREQDPTPANAVPFEEWLPADTEDLTPEQTSGSVEFEQPPVAPAMRPDNLWRSID